MICACANILNNLCNPKSSVSVYGNFLMLLRPHFHIHDQLQDLAAFKTMALLLVLLRKMYKVLQYALSIQGDDFTLP